MATTLRLLQSVLLFLAIELSYSAAQKDHFIFNGFHEANVSLDGIALIHPNGLLQLTNTSKQQKGHAFYPFPLNLRNSSHGGSLSFSTSFIFAISPEFPSSSAHGLAFTISPSTGFPGGMPSQYMGIFNSSNDGDSSNHVFAVELDTLLNPELDDVDDNHVGIDLNSLKSIESAPAAYFNDEDGKNKSLILISGEPMQIWIDYDGVEKQLNVTLSPLKIDKPNYPLLSSSIDLSFDIMDSMYVGLSAATGGLTGSHYILGWTFKVNGQAEPLDHSLLPSVPQQRQSSNHQAWKIGLSSAVVAFVLTAVYGAIYIVRKRKKKYQEIQEDWEHEYRLRRFSYKDLSIATKDFSEKELLGFGGFGKVYRGILPASSIQIAVKRVSHDSKQGLKEFIAEMASIGQLRHRNLVPLLGYCRRKRELLLVYDFMPNGSLDKFLFTHEKPVLSWNKRYQILKGVAAGLLYLHEEWEQIVLHRDIKASNVLLDGDLNGRLGDFGLARLYDRGTNPQTTQVVGTLGYLAPEVTKTGKATTYTDVYSFGAFLLEVACGRRPIEWRSEEMSLVDWVWECWKKGSILEARDRRLRDEYVLEELEMVLKLGLLCTHPTPAARPSMRQVTQFLEGDAVFPEISPNGVGIDGRLDGFSASYPTLIKESSVHSLSGPEAVLSSGGR
ncbi:L-type lectin-domain containing receptor kinase IV.1-like [Magnolia sinica]|uniref:L-type lectin-domain containing receptor kinase IV.1-like n=1 Tax=Magnolia sinica TaxID=86752 RepID=UPI002658919F|nr:L-type lectin-domain containing receptor kinase IV.1-like [Magnolia sinica]